MQMKIDIQFTTLPIATHESPPSEGTGAAVEFQGIVRGVENGIPISALHYELYELMAGRVIRQIIEQIGARHQCHCVTIVHRHGTIPAGQTAIFVRVEARHRGESFRMLEEFMNRLKTDAPIWKVGSVPC